MHKLTINLRLIDLLKKEAVVSIKKQIFKYYDVDSFHAVDAQRM
jgi:hypothetical protein